MDSSLTSWFVIVLAFILANLPFVNERVLCVKAVRRSRKPVWLRLLEMAFWYGAVLFVAHMLESRVGEVFPQTWPFYVITLCLFLVFAYPGFIFVYLRRTGVKHG